MPRLIAAILLRMATPHPKSVRRRILQILYARYLQNPLELLTPQDILEDGTVPPDYLKVNAYYLHDSGLVDVKHGYGANSFQAIRITPVGIDLVENRVAFDVRFPPAPDDFEQQAARVPSLMECLVEEADFAALDGERRKCLLRDIQYLRDELSRPVLRWRGEVVLSLISWIEGHFDNGDEGLRSLPEFKRIVEGMLN